MKDTFFEITIDDQEYLLAFDLNVMETVQAKYGSVQDWIDACGSGGDGFDASAVKFGFTEMFNEGIDIQNEENGTNRPFVTDKWVGRKLLSLGVLNVTKTLGEAVSNALGAEEADEKNA